MSVANTYSALQNTVTYFHEVTLSVRSLRDTSETSDSKIRQLILTGRLRCLHWRWVYSPHLQWSAMGRYAASWQRKRHCNARHPAQADCWSFSAKKNYKCGSALGVR